MNRLKLAIKAFFKALKEPEKVKNLFETSAKKLELKEEISDPSHLRLLNLLQKSGRLIDFLKEDIRPFSDAEVGAIVRQIHEECGKSLEELVTIRPVYQENEGAVINVEKGYDPSLVKVVGNVGKEAPFTGVLIHKGWKAHKVNLPKQVGEIKREVICPAEVEIR